jgi:hypothetical protein
MAYNTVIIKNYGNNFVEYEAYEALSPGMLLEPVSGANTIKKHATEGGDAVPIIALDNVHEGKGLEDAYVAGDKVRCWIPQRGDEAYVQIEDEQNIAIGDFLESNGAGYFQKVTDIQLSSQVVDIAFSRPKLAQALDALDLSGLSAAGSSDTPVRQFLRVRIL